MIEWLVTQLPGLSIVLLVLIACYPLAIKSLGANCYYALWLLVPLQIAVTQSQGLQFIAEQPELTQYMVLGQQSVAAMQTGSAEIATELFIFWLSGALLLSIACVWQHTWFFKRLDLCRNQNLALPVKLPFNLRVFISPKIHSPMVSGLLFPKLILPESFTEQAETKQRLMLQHELVHLQRGDLWWNALAVSLLLLFWFNPLAWLAYRRFRQAQELACDSRVLQQQSTENRLLYAKALVALAIQQQGTTFTTLYYGGKQNMKDRILNMQATKPRLFKVLPLAALLVATLPLSQAMSSQAKQESGAHKSGYEFKVSPVKRIEPRYPKNAIEQGLEGSVVLQFSVKRDGSVDNVQVLRSHPESVFDDSAVVALKQWQYAEPGAQVDNLLVQLDFVLGDSKKDNLLANMEQINVAPSKQ